MTARIDSTLRISIDELRTFCVAALQKVGVGLVDAETTADVLVTTDSSPFIYSPN